MVVMMGTGAAEGYVVDRGPRQPGSARRRAAGVSAFWSAEIHRERARGAGDPAASTFSAAAYFDLDADPVRIVRLVEAPEDDPGW